MAVSKAFGYRGGPISPIVRRPFVGDPSSGVLPELNPDPTTARGKRRRQQTEEYQKNYETRSNQVHPCGYTKGVHKGPHSRPKGVSSSEWKSKMQRKEDWDC